ncbi:MAG: ABC transporter permease [Pseudomonadota bacterium]|nr:ABC transporter permease [Pseudomonadota bacterium]
MKALSSLVRRREFLLAVVIAVLMLLVGLRAPVFLNPANLADVLNDTAILFILVLGQMLVILTRNIDLSVAANLALTGMIVALLSTVMPGLPVIFTLLLAMLIGLVLGAVNGVLVWKVGVPSIVVTLGTLSIYRGLIFVISGGEWVNANEMGAGFLAFPRLELLGLSALFWLAVAVAAAVWLMLNYTQFGREIYAAGGNPNAAVYAGIDVGRIQFYVFCLSGTLAGLCGYLWVARYAVAYVEIAQGFELQVIAACVIGDVSIAGGIGTVPGAILGALFLGIIKNALPIVGISPFWQLGISGAVIIAAVVLNAQSEKRRGRLILREARAKEEPAS